MNISSERLTIFLPGLYDGGAERILLNLAAGIAPRGFRVDLTLARAEGPYMDQIPASVRMVDLKATRVLTCLPSLIRYLRTERPAALLSALHANIPAIWARRLTGIPRRVALSEHNTLTRVSAGEHDLRWELYPTLARKFYPWADEIIAVSKGVASDLSLAADLPLENIQVIYNPIVTPELYAKAEAALDHPWFAEGEPPVILGVGRLTSQKGFDVLLDAFARVKKARTARLLILGEGEDRSALEAQIGRLGLQGDVSLPGFVSNPYPYFARTAAFVLSSRWEGLPTVLVEALALQAPIVSTDCPSGPREILGNGRYGRLVPMDEPDEMARAILEVLAERPAVNAEEGWRPYELEFVTDQYLNVLLN